MPALRLQFMDKLRYTRWMRSAEAWCR